MTKYYRVHYKTVEEFVNMVNERDPDSDNVVTMLYGPDNISLRIFNDRAPKYWTSFDDEYIVFDSWDATVESVISANRTQCFVTQEHTLTLDDTTEIDLPANYTSYLHAMAEARCFAFFKQEIALKSEQREGRQRIRSMRNKWRHQRLSKGRPDYGKR